MIPGIAHASLVPGPLLPATYIFPQFALSSVADDVREIKMQFPDQFYNEKQPIADDKCCLQSLEKRVEW